MKKEQSKLFLFKEVDDFINYLEFLSIISSSTYSIIIPIF